MPGFLVWCEAGIYKVIAQRCATTAIRLGFNERIISSSSYFQNCWDRIVAADDCYGHARVVVVVDVARPLILEIWRFGCGVGDSISHRWNSWPPFQMRNSGDGREDTGTGVKSKLGKLSRAGYLTLERGAAQLLVIG